MKPIILLGFLVIAPLFGAAQTRSITTDPVPAVRAVLPRGWTILKVEDGTYPWYRPKGLGTAIFMAISGKKYLKQDYSAVLFIMPSDYKDGGEDPTHGQAQTFPPRLIAKTKNAKLYLWPGPEAEDWKTMQQDLLRALTKNSAPDGATKRNGQIQLGTNSTLLPAGPGNDSSGAR